MTYSDVWFRFATLARTAIRRCRAAGEVQIAILREHRADERHNDLCHRDECEKYNPNRSYRRIQAVIGEFG